MIKRLDKEQIQNVCENFITGIGFKCRLNIDENIKKYLLKYKYINKKATEELYSLTPKFYTNCRKEIEELRLNKFEKELIKTFEYICFFTYAMIFFTTFIT